MSASFSIQSSAGDYTVSVRDGILKEGFSHQEELHILADEFFRPVLAPDSAKTLFIQATETAKSLDQMSPLIEHLRANGATRGTCLHVIGGGVLQDIATFVASVYMRGIPWVYYPTTILAMVDSCIGGKASINVGANKNLIGMFHPPQKILVDPSVARTLPADQFASGLIEAAKITFCRGPESFDRYLACGPSSAMSPSDLEELILTSLVAKKYFIEIDEFDKKERLLLNFGHTFGHAIEGASGYAIPHGIAVGLGILCSLHFQRNRNVRPGGVQHLEEHLVTMIRELPGLSSHLQSLDLDEILRRFASDKKHTESHYTLILVSESAKVVLERIERTPAAQAAIREAIVAMIEALAYS